MDFALNTSSYVPLYLQLAEILRRYIKVQAQAGNAELPSEKMLMETYKVGRNTAKKALEQLQSEGLIYRVQGKGTFIRKEPIDYGLHRLTGFTEEVRYLGKTPSSVVLHAQVVPAPELAAKNLRLALAQPVFLLERIRQADCNPMAYHISYLPQNVATGFERVDWAKESLFRQLEQKAGIRIAWQHQILKPIVASGKLCEYLALHPGAAVLYLEGVAYDEADNPVEFKQHYFRGDVYTFSYKSTRNDSLRIQYNPEIIA
ncbi:MAG: GntR family transcriptional regulator [Anaerolineaceae bacterium]|nr:GntR family transcriptional regulator [Anaerolineaceae bacterium]